MSKDHDLMDFVKLCGLRRAAHVERTEEERIKGQFLGRRSREDYGHAGADTVSRVSSIGRKCHRIETFEGRC